MPRLNPSRRPSYATLGSGGITAGGDGTLVLSGAANLNGNYVTVHTPAGAIDGFYLTLFVLSTATYAVSIRVGGVVVATSIPFWTAAQDGKVLFFPIRVAAGQAIEVQVGSTSGARSLYCGILDFGPVDSGFVSLVPLGPVGSGSGWPANTGVAVTPGVASYGAWVSMSGGPGTSAGALAAAVAGLALYVGNNNVGSRSSQRIALQIGVGAAGAQTVLFTYGPVGSGTATISMDNLPVLPIALAAGTQLWVRANATAAANAINVQLHAAIP